MVAVDPDLKFCLIKFADDDVGEQYWSSQPAFQKVLPIYPGSQVLDSEQISIFGYSTYGFNAWERRLSGMRALSASVGFTD